MNKNPLAIFFSRPFFSNKKVIAAVYLTAAVLISLKISFLETWDNYDCFKASYFHLIKGLDLYLPYPLEYHTSYNYSPFFAFLMGAFAHLPDWLGILFWNISHTIPFLLAVNLLPIEEKKKIFLYWFCLIEYITCTENVQTNATVTACILLVFIFQNKGKQTWSSLFFVFGSFFKIYVLTAGVFFLCYQKKGAFFIKGLAWALLFFSLPLLFISFDQLVFLYQSWVVRLQAQSLRDSLSILGVMNLFNSSWLSKEWMMLTGSVSMLLVLLKKQVHHDLSFRLLYLAAILLFTVLFNPGVESPTYIIAVAGVAIWYISRERKGWHTLLLVLVLVFTSLSPTELFPLYIKKTYLVPYHIKAIPCIIVWFVSMFELYFDKAYNIKKPH